MAIPIYIPTNSVQGFPFLYFLSNTCLSFVFLIIAIQTGVRWYIIVVLIYALLMVSDREHLSMYLLAVWLSVWFLCKNVYSVPVLILKSDFLFFCCWVVWVLYIFWIQFVVVPFVYICFRCLWFGVISKKYYHYQCQGTYPLYFLLGVSWFHSSLTVKSLIHFEVIFVYGVR